jgi:hypothetical protein
MTDVNVCSHRSEKYLAELLSSLVPQSDSFGYIDYTIERFTTVDSARRRYDEMNARMDDVACPIKLIALYVRASVYGYVGYLVDRWCLVRERRVG